MLSEVEVDPAREEIVEKVLPIPTVSFNAVYQLCHIYRHLFDATALDDVELRAMLA